MQNTQKMYGCDTHKLTVLPSRIIIDGMDYVSVEEAAEITGYDPEYIRRLLRQKKINAEKKGTMWWIDVESLKEYKKKWTPLEQINISNGVNKVKFFCPVLVVITLPAKFHLLWPVIFLSFASSLYTTSKRQTEYD